MIHCVCVVPSVFQKNGSSARLKERVNVFPVGHASLREDYLNQVQRDFLSLGEITSAPPADLFFNKSGNYALPQRPACSHAQ
jgi:hypothetical protein